MYVCPGQELAAEIGISSEALQASFDDYNRAAETKNDKFNKRFFRNAPVKVNDTFNVAIVGQCTHDNFHVGTLRFSDVSYVFG